MKDTIHLQLETGAAPRGANFAPAAVDVHLDRYSELVITLQVLSAERDSANETYDVYVITGDGFSEWDLVHFPQVAAAGAARYTARLISQGVLPQTVTGATPGVGAVDPGILTATNAPKTLGAGLVRHGPWGNTIRYELVVAGTIATGIQFVLSVQGR